MGLARPREGPRVVEGQTVELEDDSLCGLEVADREGRLLGLEGAGRDQQMVAEYRVLVEEADVVSAEVRHEEGLVIGEEGVPRRALFDPRSPRRGRRSRRRDAHRETDSPVLHLVETRLDRLQGTVGEGAGGDGARRGEEGGTQGSGLPPRRQRGPDVGVALPVEVVA
jgi:hypothetical protein